MLVGGGIGSARGPGPARGPRMWSRGWPGRESSGMVILPMVAQVAAEEPETAAKMAQPRTLVCSSRPGMLSSQGARPLNRSCESLDRNRISPIHRNSGRAVSVQLELAPQMVIALASPAGRPARSDEHTSELQSLMRISYAVFCLKKKKHTQ